MTAHPGLKLAARRFWELLTPHGSADCSSTLEEVRRAEASVQAEAQRDSVPLSTHQGVVLVTQRVLAQSLAQRARRALAQVLLRRSEEGVGSESEGGGSEGGGEGGEGGGSEGGDDTGNVAGPQRSSASGVHKQLRLESEELQSLLDAAVVELFAAETACRVAGSTAARTEPVDGGGGSAQRSGGRGGACAFGRRLKLERAQWR
eukprot:7385088-Prymnesium_polylepis.1